MFQANLSDLCLPEGAEVDQDNQIVSVKDHNKPVCIQWPCPIDEGKISISDFSTHAETNLQVFTICHNQVGCTVKPVLETTFIKRPLL